MNTQWNLQKSNGSVRSMVNDTTVHAQKHDVRVTTIFYENQFSCETELIEGVGLPAPCSRLRSRLTRVIIIHIRYMHSVMIIRNFIV